MNAVKYKFRVPKALYDELIEAFGDKSLAVDALSLYMDRYVRRNVKEQEDKYAEMEFYMYDKFQARLENALAKRGETLQDGMIKIIKRICQKKKLRLDILELALINRQNEAHL